MEYKDDLNEGDGIVEASNKILNAHMSGDVVIIVGNCTVSYEGRGWKYLDEGKRSVIIKPSGAVLVNSPNSVQPENWQPDDAETDVSVDGEEEILISSERENPYDSLLIRFTKVDKSLHYSPSDDEDTSVEGDENEMHDYLIDNPERIEDGFRVLEHEKETKYGDIDLFGEDKNGGSVIVEVKRRKASLDAVSQLDRYMEALEEFSPRGIIVAPSITQSGTELLQEKGYEFVRMKPTEVVEYN
jgi:hypothetical protein